jgi:protein-tyrosine phosphatase
MIFALLRRLWNRRPRRALDISWIAPDWAVGAAPSPTALAQLRASGITSVLDLRAEADVDASAFAAHSLHLRHIPVPDGQAPSQEQLAEATTWVLQEIAAGRRVLICCQAGSGRSVTVACALLMAMGYPLSQTLPLIFRRRPVANPTDPQIAALHAFAAGRGLIARSD